MIKKSKRQFIQYIPDVSAIKNDISFVELSTILPIDIFFHNYDISCNHSTDIVGSKKLVKTQTKSVYSVTR